MSGAPCLIDDVVMVPVTFVAKASEESDILVHLSGFTDRHRDDMTPSLMERVPSTGLLTATFLLPSDGIFSYRLADVTGLDRHAGRTRPGWREVHERGRPDPALPARLPTPLGGDASVWVGPTAPYGGWPSSETSGWVTVAAEHREIHVLPGDDRVVVLLDGQFWKPLAPGAGIRAAGHGHTVVLVPCSSLDAREVDLTDPTSATRLVRAGLGAASQILGRRVTRARLVAGQSYGGLAVAALAAEAGQPADVALVQSGSLWFPNPQTGSGWLLRRLQAGRGSVSTPVIVQVGSEEEDMVTLARLYRDALRDRGADVGYREVRGGHDYAWWRHGVIAALDEIDGLRPS